LVKQGKQIGLEGVDAALKRAFLQFLNGL